MYSLKQVFRSEALRLMKKHKITAAALGRYAGTHERGVRRFLTTKIDTDIDTTEWYLACLSDLTGEDISLEHIIQKRNQWNTIKKAAIHNSLKSKSSR